VQIKVTPTFARALKRLRKKFRKLDQDLARLRSQLEQTPSAGIPLGAGLYKIRLSSSDTTKGKSGGLRVVYYWMLRADTIVLLDLYTKNETESVPVSELRQILAAYFRQDL
jgi:mRNA-degrading endonuclease RelE of RelBE toxin-antitoxin system